MAQTQRLPALAPTKQLGSPTAAQGASSTADPKPAAAASLASTSLRLANLVMAALFLAGG